MSQLIKMAFKNKKIIKPFGGDQGIDVKSQRSNGEKVQESTPEDGK